MARSQSFWNILSGVLGGVAALVTALTGLYLALRSDSSRSAPVVATSAVAASIEPEGTQYERTPWLGVQFRQNGQAARLRSVNDSWDQFTVPWNGQAFELAITRKAEDGDIGIMAWHDESLFTLFRDEPFIATAKGIAGAEFAVPILYLDKEGFNHYDTHRFKRIDENTYSVFITTLGSGELELPLSKYTGLLHLVVFRMPSGFEEPVTRNNFEFLTLERR